MVGSFGSHAIDGRFFVRGKTFIFARPWVFQRLSLDVVACDHFLRKLGITNLPGPKELAFFLTTSEGV